MQIKDIIHLVYSQKVGRHILRLTSQFYNDALDLT